MTVGELMYYLDDFDPTREITIVLPADGPYTRDFNVFGKPWIDNFNNVRIQIVDQSAAVQSNKVGET